MFETYGNALPEYNTKENTSLFSVKKIKTVKNKRYTYLSSYWRFLTKNSFIAIIDGWNDKLIYPKIKEKLAERAFKVLSIKRAKNDVQ